MLKGLLPPIQQQTQHTTSSLRKPLRSQSSHLTVSTDPPLKHDLAESPAFFSCLGGEAAESKGWEKIQNLVVFPDELLEAASPYQ